MARSLTGAQLAEITAQNMRPAIFCQMLFTSGYVYVWSGIGSISWNGQTWTGIGSYGSVSAIPETSDLVAAGVKLAFDSATIGELVELVETELQKLYA